MGEHEGVDEGCCTNHQFFGMGMFKWETEEQYYLNLCKKESYKVYTEEGGKERRASLEWVCLPDSYIRIDIEFRALSAFFECCFLDAQDKIKSL